MYLEKINILLDIYGSLKRIDKYKVRFKSKPWINLGLQKSVSLKNKVLTKFINTMDPILKLKLNTKLQQNYRNLLNTLTKKNKQAYYILEWLTGLMWLVWLNLSKCDILTFAMAKLLLILNTDVKI